MFQILLFISVPTPSRCVPEPPSKGVTRGGGGCPGVPVAFRTLSGYVCFEILKNKWDKLEGPCFRFQTLKTAIKPPVLGMNN